MFQEKCSEKKDDTVLPERLALKESLVNESLTWKFKEKYFRKKFLKRMMIRSFLRGLALKESLVNESLT